MLEQPSRGSFWARAETRQLLGFLAGLATLAIAGLPAFWCAGPSLFASSDAAGFLYGALAVALLVVPPSVAVLIARTYPIQARRSLIIYCAVATVGALLGTCLLVF